MARYHVQTQDSAVWLPWRTIYQTDSETDAIIHSDEYAYHHEVWARAVEVTDDGFRVILDSSPL
jgi:hypothetical protein